MYEITDSFPNGATVIFWELIINVILQFTECVNMYP